MAFRWKRVPRETGLAAVGQKPRGWYLEDSETGRHLMWVRFEGWTGEGMNSTWRWYRISNDPQAPRYRSVATYPSHEEAKAAANDYWKKNKALMLEQLQKAPSNS